VSPLAEVRPAAPLLMPSAAERISQRLAVVVVATSLVALATGYIALYAVKPASVSASVYVHPAFTNAHVLAPPPG